MKENGHKDRQLLPTDYSIHIQTPPHVVFFLREGLAGSLRILVGQIFFKSLGFLPDQ
jgi:hypothetical protein